MLGARQKLDQFHSLGAGGATGCKDLDFSPLSHVVLFRLLGCFAQVWVVAGARLDLDRDMACAPSRRLAGDALSIHSRRTNREYP